MKTLLLTFKLSCGSIMVSEKKDEIIEAALHCVTQRTTSKAVGSEGREGIPGRQGGGTHFWTGLR
jgi:hypothetical protein